MYVYHIFCIHSSVDGHLGCFRVWAIVNSAAVNVERRVSFQIIVFSRNMPRSGIAEFSLWDYNFLLLCTSGHFCISGIKNLMLLGSRKKNVLFFIFHCISIYKVCNIHLFYIHIYTHICLRVCICEYNYMFACYICICLFNLLLAFCWDTIKLLRNILILSWLTFKVLGKPAKPSFQG